MTTDNNPNENTPAPLLWFNATSRVCWFTEIGRRHWLDWRITVEDAGQYWRYRIDTINNEEEESGGYISLKRYPFPSEEAAKRAAEADVAALGLVPKDA